MWFGHHHHHRGGHGRGHGRCGEEVLRGMARGGWGMGHGWGERGRGRDGGRRRLFDGDELRLVLLKLIADEPRHGYDLIRAVEAASGGAYAPSPGVVYPLLTLLADMDQVAEQQGGGARRVFAATDAGRHTLEEQAELVDALFARLAALGEAAERAEPPSVRRAMANLGMALGARVPHADRAALEAIADLLDETARRIERL